MKPPHVLLPSACSQTKTFHSIGSMPTSHLEVIVMLALGLGAIRCLKRLTLVATQLSHHTLCCLPRDHRQRPCPHVSKVLTIFPKQNKDKTKTPERQQGTQKAIFLGFFLFSQKQTAKASAEQSKTPTTNTKSKFFGGFLFSQKQTAKASTEQNKTSKKQTQKATKTT